MLPRILIALVVLAAVAVLIFVLAKPIALIQIRDGRVIVRRGNVPQRKLSELESVVLALSVPDGQIRVVSSADGEKLRFSASLPEPCHQYFRNAWHGS